MIPILMMLVQASDAAKLSGLTPHQLREWCGRRELLRPDVPAAGRGHLALFSWQTILALRVLNELHTRFAVEVGAWRAGIGEAQLLLRSRSFPTLWGAAMAFPNAATAAITHDRSLFRSGDCLFVELDKHLDVLAHTDGIPAERQLPLFPPSLVGR